VGLAVALGLSVLSALGVRLDVVLGVDVSDKTVDTVAVGVHVVDADCVRVPVPGCDPDSGN